MEEYFEIRTSQCGKSQNGFGFAAILLCQMYQWEFLLRKLKELDQYVITVWRWFNAYLPLGLSKAETQALTNYGSGEDENEDEEIEFEEGPVDVQTSLQASNETATENEQVSPGL